MPSHMTSLGFSVTTEQDFRHYVYQASEFGQKVETPNGSYTCWTPGGGIELWVQTNLHKRIIGMNPHFEGHARIQLGLTQRIPRYTHSILDGSFSGWTHPSLPNNTLRGDSLLAFDAPDYDRYYDLHLPRITSVQLAAFAYELQGYENEAAYVAAQSPSTVLASQTLLPEHLGSQDRIPSTQAQLSGRVLVTNMLTNPVTSQKYYWARIQTYGGELDIVADPQVVQGKVVKHGIVKGRFWLSGKLVIDSSS